MTSPAPEAVVPDPTCALCGAPATDGLPPSRRTVARGLDPEDPSYSVTAILPDVPLCAAHLADVKKGDRLVGWCDDERCRSYGEVGEASACGELYKKFGPAKRS